MKKRENKGNCDILHLSKLIAVLPSGNGKTVGKALWGKDKLCFRQTDMNILGSLLNFNL